MHSINPETAGGHQPSVATQDPNVNYDEAALVEVEVEGVEFRVDPGKQGTALCVSRRAVGTWDWSFVGEARWDGSALRAKTLERQVLLPLSAALKQAMEAL